MWEALGQDLLYGLRLLAKNPGFTSVVVRTPALGIGADAAVFSFEEKGILKPSSFVSRNRLGLPGRFPFPKWRL